MKKSKRSNEINPTALSNRNKFDPMVLDTITGRDWSDKFIFGTKGDDDLTADSVVGIANLFSGDDTFSSTQMVGKLFAGSGDDDIRLDDGGGTVRLGHGDDSLTIGAAVGLADGGKGEDTLIFNQNQGAFDILVAANSISFIDRFSGSTTTIRNFEQIEFNDASYDIAELRSTFDSDVPAINVGSGTQTVTVNDPDPTVSIVWDRTVQQAVIQTDSFVGPTIASRAYAMVHTAIFDAWASYDDTAVRVSFDVENDNAALASGAVETEANKAKAMSFAAFTVLQALFPDQAELFNTVMGERYGYSLTDDGSKEAAIGIDAAMDLLAHRMNDGSNQANGYASQHTPTNANPQDIKDITAWTPEYVPIDPEDGSGGQPLQSFLTAQWGGVESFALAENSDGTTDHSDALPPDPETFFSGAYAGSTLNYAAKTITLSAALSLDGVNYAAGDTVAVSKALIGSVINKGFIDQAEVVIDYSANLNDKQKITAEFWEDGGGTAFPPGTFMSFAQFVSARDDHSLDDDAKLFLSMGNAVFDAGVSTWNAKVDLDYARPVRAIRDLGELGLIGEQGEDHLGNEGFVISAFAGFDPITGQGLGTRDILATDFITFQRPGTDSSPPFSEYTSGHSAFSAAGAQILEMYTGSDKFGGSVTFAPDSIQFEPGVPGVETTLSWDTFTEAADEAGLSRLYGGIHFEDGDFSGRVLGRQVATDVYDLSQMFINGTATDADRPFYEPEDTII